MIVLWAGISLSCSLCSSIVFSLIIVEKHYTIAKINEWGGVSYAGHVNINFVGK